MFSDIRYGTCSTKRVGLELHRGPYPSGPRRSNLAKASRGHPLHVCYLSPSRLIHKGATNRSKEMSRFAPMAVGLEPRGVTITAQRKEVG